MKCFLKSGPFDAERWAKVQVRDSDAWTKLERVGVMLYTLSTFSVFKLHIGINKVGHCDCKHITTQKVSYTYVYYIYVIDTYN